ncbi:MAG: MerR family transcriptional regulator [Thermoanaerobaculia bacterium]
MTKDGTSEQPRYSIGELAKLGGVSRRTVRYYVQRGLLEAPTGLGRGRHYTQRHLDTLIRIRKLQEAGRPLAAIDARIGPDRKPEPRASSFRPPRPTRFATWTRIEIIDGVELHLRDVRLDSRQARAAGEAISKIIHKGTFDER